MDLGSVNWLAIVVCVVLAMINGFKVWAIEAGNHLLNLLLFGAILAAWR